MAKDGFFIHGAWKNEKVRIRLLGVFLGLGLPLMVSIVMYLLRPEPVKWLFRDTRKLITTTGTITESHVELRGSPAFNAVGWHYIIRYEYNVMGQLYESDMVNYGDTGSSNRDYSVEYIEKYPKGKTVLVYYDPLQPEKAVLEPWVKDYQIVYLIGGCLLFGIIFIVLAYLAA